MRAKTVPNKELENPLDDAFTAFTQSRKAKNVTKATMEFYHATAEKFHAWLKEQGYTDPEQINGQTIEGYLAHVHDSEVSDNTLHAHARTVKTILIYWEEAEFIAKRIRFKMPKVGDVNHQTLSFDQITALIDVCISARDKAIIALMVDTGIRRQEVINLNWVDIDLKTGNLHVIRGKGRKNRWLGFSPATVRYLVAYRKECTPDLNPDSPVFVTREGGRMQGMTMLLLFRRLSTRVGFSVHSHMLRHTYATQANLSGMSLYNIQATMGHASSETTERYIKSLPSAIIETQIDHSIMMQLKRKRK